MTNAVINAIVEAMIEGTELLISDQKFGNKPIAVEKRGKHFGGM